jgi:hypothetical protein
LSRLGRGRAERPEAFLLAAIVLSTCRGGRGLLGSLRESIKILLFVCRKTIFSVSRGKSKY